MKTVFALLALLAAVPAIAGSIEGTVYRSDGTTLEATVTAYLVESSAAQTQRWNARAPRTAIATTKTSEGRFTFDKLPDSAIDVEVRAMGYAPQVVRTITNDAPLSIVMREAAMVEGRVSANGKPVSEAYVVWVGPLDVEYATTTDANGRYRVPDPMRWAAMPRVMHATLELDASQRRRPDVLNLELQPRAKEGAAPRGSGSISGTVRVGKTPLAGVPVLLRASGDEERDPIRVVTDAKGRYLAEGLPPRRTHVMIGEGFEPRFRVPYDMQVVSVEGPSPAVAQLDKERTATIDLMLIPAPLISGRVTDADQKPVAGAIVQVVLAGRSSLEFASDAAARTATDGRYTIAAPPFDRDTTVELAVRTRNRSTVRSKPFALRDEKLTVDVALPRFESVTLRVTGADRTPIPNAQVAFASSEELVMYRDAGTLLLPGMEGRALRTDANGTVALQLVAGSYDFAATANGFQTKAISGREIARGATVEIALDPAFAIRGRVHRNGVGVAGVYVGVAAGERRRRETQPVTTGADGTFVLDGLARGKYRVIVNKHDELINKSIDAEAPSMVDVALPSAGTLRGRVLDATTREPVREFLYAIEAMEAEDPTSPGVQRAENRADGTFTVTLPAGRYRVNATSGGYTQAEPVEVRVSDGEPATVDLLLGRGVTISGRITDDAGSPIAGVNVFAQGPDGERMRTSSTLRMGPGNTTTSDDGTFSISGLEAGTIQLVARKEGFVPARKTITADGATTIDLQLSRGLTIEGVVTRSGKPVAQVQVGASTAALGGDHQPALTDATGRFTLRGLIPARYTVMAFKDEMHGEVRDVDPTKQRELAISLDPQPTGVLFGTVTGLPTNLGGKIVRRVVFAQNEERGTEGLIDETGNYRIEDAPTGSVFVSAQVESTSGGSSSIRKRVDVVAGQPLRVDLDLGGSITVRGRVTLEGKPIGGARVVFTADNDVAGSTISRDDGAYELALSAPGTYQIFAHAEMMAMRNGQLVREVRGNETIDIDLREQTIEGVVVDAVTRAPIAGAFVTLAPAALPTLNSIVGESMTDANGRFRIPTAASGAHRVVAAARGYAHVTQAIQLGSSRTQQLAFELSKTGELRVRVFDAKTGTPLEAHIVVEGVPVRGERAVDGETTLFSLAEGKYRVTVIVPGYAAKRVDVVAPGGVDIAM